MGEPYELKYIYNDEGKLIGEKSCNIGTRPESLHRLRRYKYNEKGQLVSEAYFNHRGDQKEDIEYLYDDNDNMVKKIFHNRKVPSYTEDNELYEEYKCDEKGRRIELREALHLQGKWCIRYEYNDRGSVVREKYYYVRPHRGKTLPQRLLYIYNPYHISDIVYRYDQRGCNTEVKLVVYGGDTQIEKSEIGRSGRGTVAATLYVKYRYDDKGNVVEGKTYWNDAFHTPTVFRVEYN